MSENQKNDSKKSFLQRNLFLIVIFLIVRLTDILKLLDKSTTNISSLDSKIQNLDKKVSDTDENYNELKKSFQSADKENFNLIQFPLDLSEKIDKFTKTIQKRMLN